MTSSCKASNFLVLLTLYLHMRLGCKNYSDQLFIPEADCYSSEVKHKKYSKLERRKADTKMHLGMEKLT